MSQEEKKFFTPVNILIISVFTGIAGYVYYGFYFPDPTSFYIHDYAKLFLNAIKLFYPIIVISLIVLYRFIYLKKIQLSSVILLFFTFFFFLLLAYPVADYFYRNNLAVNTDEFHPYLQINPPSVKNIESEKFNIFCLGGSTTEFEDESGRDWPGLVQKDLNKELPYKDVRLYNFGKQWYSSQHILINYTLNLKQYKPDVIIVMENINDLLHNADFSWLSSGKYRDDYGHFLGPLARLVKYKSFIEFMKQTIKRSWYNDNYIEITTDYFPGIKAFERNLNTLISLSKEDGTKIILMTQPNIYKESMSTKELSKLTMLNVEAIGNGKKWTYRTALNGFRQYNEKIRKIALTNEDVSLIDLEKIVPKNLEYLIDDVHYNSKTHDLIAQFLSAELKIILRNEISSFLSSNYNTKSK
ncbi:MAG: SGNH/GDSL hydrolase family protein [Ignavibacteria bacterium]|nr:SGNH/GDSL hydrolase family protein [Ignavibacteria bacterium]